MPLQSFSKDDQYVKANGLVLVDTTGWDDADWDVLVSLLTWNNQPLVYHKPVDGMSQDVS